MVAGALDLKGGTQPPNPAADDKRIWIDANGAAYILEDDGTNTLLTGVGGSVGATDNAVPRADGTGGDTLQASGVLIDDSNNVSLVSVDASGGPSRFRGDLVSQSDNFVVRSRVPGGAGVGGNAVFWFLNGDRGATGASGFGFFLENFTSGDYRLFRAVNGAFGTGLIRVTPTGVWSLESSVTTPSATGVPQLANVSGELVVVDGAGNATTLSPHPHDTLVDTDGRPTTYVHKEENAYTGSRVELDVYQALKDLEDADSTGQTQYIYESRVALERRQNARLARYKSKRRAWRERKVN